MGDRILVTPYSNLGAMRVFMLVEFREQQRFRFLHSNIGGDPAFILRVNNSRIVNTEVYEPVHDVCHSLFLWRKHVVNLFGSEMLSILLGVWMRTSW